MNRIFTIIASLIVAVASLSAKNSSSIPATELMMPDMTSHYDRIMESFTEGSQNLFTSALDIDMLEIDDNDDSDSNALRNSLADYAKKFLGRRYVRGGKGPSGFDCSGFTSYVFRNFGYALNSASRSQSTQGERIALKDAKVGDLIFFSGRRGGKTVGHVGMVVEVDDNGKMKFIHASTSKGVVIQSYPDGGYYSRRFLHMQRVIS